MMAKFEFSSRRVHFGGMTEGKVYGMPLCDPCDMRASDLD